MIPDALNYLKPAWLRAIVCVLALSFPVQSGSAQSSLADAEKISAQTGRTLFVVAGKKT